MNSMAETGKWMGIPEGSLISMASLVDTAVLPPRIALDWGLAAS